MIHIIKKSGKFFKLMVIIFALILIQFVYAGTVRISPPTSTPSQNFTVNVNSTCYFNINNSDLLDGFDSSYFYPYSNPYNFINTTSDSWSTNYTSYYTKTQLDNGTWIKNNTSPTFVNVTATTGILSLIYDLAGILTIDINNHLLYDLASVLSLDFNDRVLYASDGTDKILDWYNVGIADFGNSNITTTGNVSSSHYCNSTNCYTVNDFLIDTTGGTDSWAGNYTLYYNKTLIDHNFTFYYLKTDIDNNFTLYYTKTESNANLNNNVTSINSNINNNFTASKTYTNGVIAGNLTLTLLKNGTTIATGNFNFGGYNISNIDNITVNKYCNSTKCYLLSDFLSTTGDGSFNTTYHNYVTANYSNNSLFWQGHTGTDGSWLTGLPSYNSSYVPYTGATSDVDLGSNQLYFGSSPSIYGLTEHEFRIQISDGSFFSFLDYGGNLIITGDSGGNDVNLGSITYPFTRAIFDTLTISGANITDSTGAITFDNENLTTSSYGFFGWLGSLTNRITKAWFTNLDLNGTIQMNQGNITNATYIIMNEKSGACDLTINHSICSNLSGTFLIGIIIPLL